MDNWKDAILLGAGLIVLWIGGEMLVKGSARIARRMGISALIVGLTVVAFGTSAPELAVSVQAAMAGHHGIAIGNVMGSNIANILLILGAAALARPLSVSLKLTQTDGPIMFLVTCVFLVMCYSEAGAGIVTRWEGLFLVFLLVAYNLFTYFVARREAARVREEFQETFGKEGSVGFNVGLVIVGIVGLVIGGRFIVEGATGIAKSYGVPEEIIGLTIVAVGTSLPELATSIIAARHNMPDIAIGNVVGSNIFNVLSVVGFTAAIRPIDVERHMLFYDGPVVLGVCVVFLIVARSGQKIARWEGLLLLLLYGGYLAWTVQRTLGGG